MLNAADHDDPFTIKGKEISLRGRSHAEYPTPNPSSSIGRSSSPSRQEPDNTPEAELGTQASTTVAIGAFQNSTPTRPSVNINKDFNILNPDLRVLRVPLLAARPQITVGRSSKACDYYLRAGNKTGTAKMDKTVSRRHVLIQHSATKMVFTCLGHNGFTMAVPRTCGVEPKKDAKSEHEYVLVEAAVPLQNNAGSKTIRLDSNCTEFHVFHNESVEMPRFANVLLQIRDHVVLVNPDDHDEELTDDEIVTSTSAAATVGEKNSKHPAMGSMSVTNTIPSKFSTPRSIASSLPQTPCKVGAILEVPNQPEETTPSVRKTKKTSAVNEENKENHNPSHNVAKYESPSPASSDLKRPSTPLANKSTNLPKTNPVKRRAASEEPTPVKKVKKEAEHDSEGKLIISQECIKKVSNVKEIENILVNHLAFSRLSSTPASVLNTISATVAKLSLRQLRTVLYNASCIGVIYRQGKDAAGKPLEEEYFYEPEKDQDLQRIQLLSLIKGHGGLRACRKTHKQYYWKKPAAKK